MQTLKALLGNLPLDAFLEKYFTRHPIALPGPSLPFAHLLDWDRVREVMSGKESVLRIVQDGRVVQDYVDLTFDEAQTHYRQGRTLLLRYAERTSPALQALAQEFSHAFKTEVDIQLYCTPEGHNAFGWHYDVEEVFILQTKGSKEYTIRPNTVHPLPLVSSIGKDLGYEKEKTPEQLSVVLGPGDFLYIPSGWWHVARTRQESMHISIGLMPRSAVDILEYLPKFLAQDVFWRTRMPAHHEFENEEQAVSFYQEAMRTLGKSLADRLSSPEFIKSFLASRDRFPKS